MDARRLCGNDLCPDYAQTEQRVEVRIHDYACIASHATLLLNTPAVVAIRHSGVDLLTVRTSVDNDAYERL